MASVKDARVYSVGRCDRVASRQLLQAKEGASGSTSGDDADSGLAAKVVGSSQAYVIAMGG